MNEEINHQESISNSSAKTSEKYVFYRKPSIKKKAPEIRQTKTSRQRMLKANPLLMYKEQNMEIPNLLKQSSESVEQVKSKELSSIRNPVEISHTKKLANNSAARIARKRLGSIISSNSSGPQANQKPVNTFTKHSPIKFSKSSKMLSSTRMEKNQKPIKSASNSNKNKPKKDECKKMVLENKKTLRRSLSAQHFDLKKALLRTDSEKSINKIKHSKSTPNMNKEENDIHPVNYRLSIIQEISPDATLSFKTPSAYERRSIMSTPLSEACLRRSLYQPSTHLPSLHELQKRLNDWLMKRGKSISLFHHLKSFDFPTDVIDEEDKENIETNRDFEKGSYEDLQIKNQSEEAKRKLTVITNDNIEQVTKSALGDLLNLIQDGYPLNQCESWLQLIKERYTQLQEEPEYWECRAAIEEARGNISKAVECYKTAIIQGAEVHDVDKSLDVLLQKFSLLNINAEAAANQKISKERERIVKDARNVFKSSIIKFAVQEKKLKKNENDVTLVATPVRRSARLSRSGYISTPGVQIYSTLKELDSPVRASVNFQSNKALN